MSQAFLGEVRLFGWNFAPLNWLPCNGQLMSISQNTALFSLLGVTYGGDGRVTFGLPNLQGSAVVGAGTPPGGETYTPGETGGEFTVTLLATNLPSHTHAFNVCSPRAKANLTTPTATSGFAKADGVKPFNDPASPPPKQVTAAPFELQIAGSPAPTPHNNTAPYLTVGYCICTNGIFPQRP
jgi:microcystin-dependent protein